MKTGYSNGGFYKGGERISGDRPPTAPTVQQPNRRDIAAEDVRGTDTPPEKVPRRVLPANFAPTDNSGSSLFENIMHKFVKVDNNERVIKRSHSLNGSLPTDADRKGVHKEETAFQPLVKAKDNAVNFKEKPNQGNMALVETDDDVAGPETPGMKPLASQVKRSHEDTSKFGCLLNSKRVRFLDHSMTLDMTKKEVEVASKFEWLDPSRIRDANGRRPNNPLYDRTTLYIPPEVLTKLSASQKQYWSVKCKYMDVVLFFKVGKFYELYEMDADIGHKELDWKITLSGVGKCRQVGISESGIDDAVQKLVARGYKVGRVEQLETSEAAKARGANSVVRRKLVQVVTPSTNVDGNIGPDAVHLLSIKEENNDLDNGSVVYGFAFVDCARLRFWVGSIEDDASCSALGALLMQVSPKEVMYDSRGLSKEAQKALRKFSLIGSATLQFTPVQSITDKVNSEIRDLIDSKGYFKGSSHSLDLVLNNVIHPEITLSALGGLIGLLDRLMLDDVLLSGDLYPYQVYKGCLKMDGPTMINLELFVNNEDGSLYNCLDKCVTSSGKRLLRNWLCCPLIDAEIINNRLDVVDDLMANPEIVSHIAQHLRKLPDLEHLLGRIKSSLQLSGPLLLPLLGKKILKQRVKVFGSLVNGVRTALSLLLLLMKEQHLISSLTKVFKLPILTGSEGLDQFLIQFEAAVRSDFPNYQFENIGYMIEMEAKMSSFINYGHVCEHDSDAETLTILAELFLEKAAQWFDVVHAINCIDVLRSFAVTSSFSCGTMSRPVIVTSKGTSVDNGGTVLKMKGLWHPFALGDSGCLPVPNDIILGESEDGSHPRTLLLTGPNMGGKSTLLRSTCLAVIMAQCTETASVLQNATQDSLVILDELGRGTSTFDGYAIAYAVFRHLIEKVNCRMLFATHYHPLTKEFASHPRVTMQHMACAFKSKSDTYSTRDRELVFLYRLASGACPESYGLQVALMAGIPEKTVDIASIASQQMKKSIGQSFRSSEQRSEFSTLHEEWLKTLVSISRLEDCNWLDEDVLDTLVCVWYELKTSFISGK
ncbi:unnamed protein product [Sphenostylis stenocarpa]|uniref:DNA mismatch repair proteins mutS family domain-containing protein n=1 Tax=Sphenostylis stenocarpa TaxID=92480 RepID=A0AA86VYH6_9FABA|nr:unnamed protein product [Sphenostylis stenocarpa]